MSLKRHTEAWARMAAAVFGAALITAAAQASGVTSSTQLHDYRVSGTTMSGLVGYMMSHPFPGDEGPALANIRPTYSLAIKTQDQGGVCRPSDVSLNIRFVMTLPKAVDAGSLTGATKVAWYQFVAFARHHEETRRSIYLQCGRPSSRRQPRSNRRVAVSRCGRRFKTRSPQQNWPATVSSLLMGVPMILA